MSISAYIQIMIPVICNSNTHTRIHADTSCKQVHNVLLKVGLLKLSLSIRSMYMYIQQYRVYIYRHISHSPTHIHIYIHTYIHYINTT